MNRLETILAPRILYLMPRTPKFIIALAAATVTPSLHAQQADTIVIDKPQQVIITQTADSIDIRVAGREGNPDYRFEQQASLSAEAETVTTTAESRHSPLGWDFSFIENNTNSAVVSLELAPRLEGGILIPMGTPDGMNTSFWKSVESTFSILTLKLEAPKGKWWVALDWGSNMKIITLKGDRQFTSDRAGRVSLSPYPEGATHGKSRLLTIGEVLALNYNYRIGKEQALGLGVEWEMRGKLWDHCRSIYTDADGQKTKQLHDTKLRVSNFNFKLTWLFADHCSLYARYSPWSPFRKGEGPQFSTLSFGFGVGF